MVSVTLDSSDPDDAMSTLVQPRIVPIRIPCIELATIYDEVPSLKAQGAKNDGGADKSPTKDGPSKSDRSSISPHTRGSTTAAAGAVDAGKPAAQPEARASATRGLHYTEVENQPSDPSSDVFFWFTVRKYGLDSMPVSLIKT